MKIKLITIPNLLTLSNLLCGSFAAVQALVYGDVAAAAWLIIAAAAFDFFDGFAARLLHQSSPIGVELDSLADDISFGFAPAAILFAMYGSAPAGAPLSDAVFAVGRYGLFVMAAFSALRLAKFNIDDTQREEFTGLSTTANAIFCASLGLLAAGGDLLLSKTAIFVLAVVMSLLLVSPVRMFALKFHGFGWRGNELRYSFIAVGAVLLALLRVKAVPVLILLYIAVSAVRWLGMRKRPDSGN